MTLLYECEPDEERVKSFAEECDPLWLKSKAESMIEFVLDYLECPYETEIDLTITDNDGIHELNRQYREVDAATDVLSFPMVDYEKPFDFSMAEENPDSYFNPESGELLLGDIVISLEKVAEQAQNYGHSVLREYSFLIVHSMLHLFGYDHIEEADRIVMEELQDRIMDAAGITR
ncbi:MAG: rRNA maturation RNase YbeY [Lachnospiraceae bacterium]|nr:rRNA maturation RNase YbeY [Lachnospiraceae bacterium]